eukprot:TRINITY_DN19675_c0_g1_i1.p1 TRINITY_DN19675_c0_g1~~TRINITY_DN19675_c0_g1_i1.p1  ORF type:complete len:120 (-),score=34.07 TRINITY_DN19675_c0_g1_i1:182-541(-)
MQKSGETTADRKNVIQVSTRRDRRFFMYLAKLVLSDFQTAELHALGEAISIAVNVAEQLERLQYVKITKIETLTFESEQKGRNDRNYNRKKVKLIVAVERAQGFAGLMSTFKRPANKKQ